MDQNQYAPVAQQPKKMSGRTKAALWCLIGPTGLLIVTFVGFAVLNLIFSAVATPTPIDGAPESLFGEPATGGTLIAQTLFNIVLFITGAISTLAWFPGIIVGIVLLATKKPTLPPQV